MQVALKIGRQINVKPPLYADRIMLLVEFETWTSLWDRARLPVQLPCQRITAAIYEEAFNAQIWTVGR